MITKNTNLQRLDWNNKNLKNYFKSLQEQKGSAKLTISDKLEMVFGPIIFALAVIVWVYIFAIFGA